MLQAAENLMKPKRSGPEECRPLVKRRKSTSKIDIDCDQFSLESVPSEITTIIVEMLPPKDLGTFSVTNTKWNKFCVDILKRKIAKQNPDQVTSKEISDWGVCIKRTTSFWSHSQKIAFFDALSKINDFVFSMEVDLWRVITAGWQMSDTVKFVNGVWQQKGPELFEKTRSRTEQKQYEDLMNLTYEITTVWDLNRAVKFCIEVTKDWTTQEQGQFMVSLFERHVDESVLLSEEPDINFIVKIVDAYTTGWTEKNKLDILNSIFPQWTQKEIQDFLKKYTLEKTPTVFAFLRRLIAPWHTQQISNFIVKMTGSMKMDQFIQFIQEMCTDMTVPNRTDLVRRTVMGLKHRYLTYQCGCGECRERYLDRISILAMLGLEKFVM